MSIAHKNVSQGPRRLRRRLAPAAWLCLSHLLILKPQVKGSTSVDVIIENIPEDLAQTEAAAGPLTQVINPSLAAPPLNGAASALLQNEWMLSVKPVSARAAPVSHASVLSRHAIAASTPIQQAVHGSKRWPQTRYSIRLGLETVETSPQGLESSVDGAIRKSHGLFDNEQQRPLIAEGPVIFMATVHQKLFDDQADLDWKALRDLVTEHNEKHKQHPVTLHHAERVREDLLQQNLAVLLGKGTLRRHPEAAASPERNESLEALERDLETVRSALNEKVPCSSEELAEKTGLKIERVQQLLRVLERDEIAHKTRSRSKQTTNPEWKWTLVAWDPSLAQKKLAFKLALTGGHPRIDTMAHILVEASSFGLNRETARKIIEDLVKEDVITEEAAAPGAVRPPSSLRSKTALDLQREFRIGSRYFAVHAFEQELRLRFGDQPFRWEDAVDSNEKAEYFIELQEDGKILNTDEKSGAGQELYRLRSIVRIVNEAPAPAAAPVRKLLTLWADQPADAKYDIYLSPEVESALAKLKETDEKAYEESISRMRLLALHGKNIQSLTPNDPSFNAKPLRSGIWELRPWGHRFYYFFPEDIPEDKPWIAIWNYGSKTLAEHKTGIVTQYEDQTRRIEQAAEFSVGDSFRKWLREERIRRGLTTETPDSKSSAELRAPLRDDEPDRIDKLVESKILVPWPGLEGSLPHRIYRNVEMNDLFDEHARRPLPANVRDALTTAVRRVAADGVDVGSPDVEPVSGKIQAIKHGAYRIVFFEHGADFILVDAIRYDKATGYRRSVNKVREFQKKHFGKRGPPKQKS